MNDYRDLNGINPKNILKDRSNGIFLGLGLISNDLGDLIYLQGLHARNSKFGRIVCAEFGRAAGRNIYILRLALSQLYNILKFFFFREEDIKNNQSLILIKKTFSNDEKVFWEIVIKLAKEYKRFGKKQLSIPGINPEIIKIINLSESARDNLTFHYYGTNKYLMNGFDFAFIKKPQMNTKHAYITEINDVTKDRRYYIDISIQRFLEEKLGSGKDIFEEEKKLIDFLAAFNKVVSRILSEFHKSLGFEVLS